MCNTIHFTNRNWNGICVSAYSFAFPRRDQPTHICLCIHSINFCSIFFLKEPLIKLSRGYRVFEYSHLITSISISKYTYNFQLFLCKDIFVTTCTWLSVLYAKLLFIDFLCRYSSKRTSNPFRQYFSNNPLLNIIF